MQWNYIRFYLLIIFYICYISGRIRTLNKHWFITITRKSLFCDILIKVGGHKTLLKQGTSRFDGKCLVVITTYINMSWTKGTICFIPCNCFDWTQGNNLNIFYPRGTKAHWVHTSNVLTGCKEIICRESSQVGSSLGFLNWKQGNNTKRVIPRDTKEYWVLSLNIFEVTTCWLHIHRTSIDLSSSDITNYFDIYCYQSFLSDTGVQLRLLISSQTKNTYLIM